MAVIFKVNLEKDTIKEFFTNNEKFNNMFNRVKNSRLLMRVACLIIIGMMSIGVCIVSVGITLGFKVNYEGSFIATVKNATVFDDAKSIAVSSVDSSNAEAAIKTPSFKMTLTVADSLTSAIVLADAIIENTNDIVKATALVVNGEQVICAEADELDAALDTARTRFDVEGAENSSEFTAEVKLQNGYHLKNELESGEAVKAAAESLEVKTVSVVTKTSEIAFSKKTVKDSSKKSGYSEVTTKGEKGERTVTESIEAVNGAQAARTVVSNVVTKEPVAQVTVVGTAKAKAAASTERSLGFICPLKRGTFRITAYVGDGRGHKGMDLATDKGDAIYAVSAGTVVASGWNGAYGYCVDIDHGNGIKTRYAHASALNVKKGDKVSQGDVIALVGNTGRSTGNHLHFEVIKGGTQVNPTSYVSFK